VPRLRVYGALLPLSHSSYGSVRARTVVLHLSEYFGYMVIFVSAQTRTNPNLERPMSDFSCLYIQL
jgi:hypothetical protein